MERHSKKFRIPLLGMVQEGEVEDAVVLAFPKCPCVKGLVPGWYFWDIVEPLRHRELWLVLKTLGNVTLKGILGTQPGLPFLFCFSVSDVSNFLCHALLSIAMWQPHFRPKAMGPSVLRLEPPEL